MIFANIEKQILKFLNEYGQASIKQLRKLFHATDRNLQNLIENDFARKNEEVIMVRSVKGKDEKLLYAIDLLIFFLKKLSDVNWHTRATFPFYITFYRNNKVFDITVVYPGEETLMETAINRSQANRVIVIAPYKIRPLKLKQEIGVRYYIPKNKKFYKADNNSFVEE